ncbi:unnamed protein product [Linum tenue]|uniref:Uncharacterized protein n=1 Tax=Linum tenue TaxID=586396 RepID=A0AAV0JAE8_9ROSI|nr:unnamed protein product [Linum tenue]
MLVRSNHQINQTHFPCFSSTGTQGCKDAGRAAVSGGRITSGRISRGAGSLSRKRRPSSSSIVSSETSGRRLRLGCPGGPTTRSRTSGTRTFGRGS